jgi:hypothetical protein
MSFDIDKIVFMSILTAVMCLIALMPVIIPKLKRLLGIK